jgi:hypothetical protein
MPMISEEAVKVLSEKWGLKIILNMTLKELDIDDLQIRFNLISVFNLEF